jgi:hypothetical protein
MPCLSDSPSSGAEEASALWSGLLLNASQTAPILSLFCHQSLPQLALLWTMSFLFHLQSSSGCLRYEDTVGSWKECGNGHIGQFELWFFDLRIWRVRKTYFHIYILRTQTQKFTSLITQITPLSSIFYPISFLSPLLFNSLSLRNKESTWGMFSKRGRYNMPVVFLLSLKNWSFSGFCLLWNCSLHLSHVWQSSTNTLS